MKDLGMLPRIGLGCLGLVALVPAAVLGVLALVWAPPAMTVTAVVGLVLLVVWFVLRRRRRGAAPVPGHEGLGLSASREGLL